MDCSLHLYEHQSTISPNMALRNLFYVSREYEKLIGSQSIYSSKRIMLPAPFFIVFYNGTDGSWDKHESKLSDSFLMKQDCPNLELIVTEINLNSELNNELLRICKPLWEYMQYIDKVRTYSSFMKIEEAVERAVNESIQEGILEKFLVQYKREAILVSIFEFDEEREMRIIRADERELGQEEGFRKALELFVRNNLLSGIPETQIIQTLTTLFELKSDDARTVTKTIKASVQA